MIVIVETYSITQMDDGSFWGNVELSYFIMMSHENKSIV